MANPHRRIVIAGGSGFLGKSLAQDLVEQGDDLVILTRQPERYVGAGRAIAWDGETLGEWASQFEGLDVLINLAGRHVNCRYNAANKRAIYDSRLKSTRVLGEAIARCARPPRVWINSSSATIYRHAEDRAMDETSGEIGSGFSVDVCQQWERTLNEAVTPHTRKVALRSAIVFGHGAGGPFEVFHRLVRWGLGGTMGPGTQFVSWVHVKDFCRAIRWIVDHDELSGPVNCAAPNPLPNREFMRLFRRACRQPVGLPATQWMLVLGTMLLRTETELVLKSRRVVPQRLLESGFRFEFPEWPGAVGDLVGTS